MFKKVFRLFLITAILSSFPCSLALADDYDTDPETEISSAELYFSLDKTPRAGEIVGSFFAQSSDKRYVVEGSLYCKKDDTWDYGDVPVAEIELSAAEGYRFPLNPGKSFFKLNGLNATFKSVEIEDEGDTLLLQVALPSLAGALPATTATSWTGRNATWDAVPGTDAYNVKLYKNSSLITTQEIETNYIDFDGYMSTEGAYTFSVQALSNANDSTGPWVECADTLTLTDDDLISTDGGTWTETDGGMRYVYKDGIWPSSTWRNIDGTWYYFNSAGYPVSNSYVLSPFSDGYIWVGEDGIWDGNEAIETPDSTLYTIYS